jgi:L-fuculose-phosphate aldolase
LDARTIPESYLFLRDVARIAYGVQYGVGSPAIEDCIGMHSPAGIVENDGVVVVGDSILDAFDRLEVLEATAEAIINARCVGEIATMAPAHIDALRSAFGIQ